jgi:hypothetical protein
MKRRASTKSLLSGYTFMALGRSDHFYCWCEHVSLYLAFRSVWYAFNLSAAASDSITSLNASFGSLLTLSASTYLIASIAVRCWFKRSSCRCVASELVSLSRIRSGRRVVIFCFEEKLKGVFRRAMVYKKCLLRTYTFLV